jgi:Rps23 Pro-64 3,4-dihydroxylase Tpa1-like proline 4-hydroxylase
MTSAVQLTAEARRLERGIAHPSLDETFESLSRRARELAKNYQRATPYPFAVIDDFLPTEVAERLLADFPSPRSEVWRRLPSADQFNKLTLSDDRLMPESIRSVVHELNSGAFLRILEEITGIGKLLADTKLVGGGLHQIDRGGHLNVHVDYSHHPETMLNRRLNLILYLNKDWKEEFGGHFELWDAKVTRYEHRIAPLFNRCVIFSTTSYSYHGHPEPLTCPDGFTRKSIALYYYSNGRPEENGPIVEHNTLFRLRPGDRFSLGNFLVRSVSSGWVRDLTPPVFYRWLRWAWNRSPRLKK